MVEKGARGCVFEQNGGHRAPQTSNLNIVFCGMDRYHPRAHTRRVSSPKSTVTARNPPKRLHCDCCKSCVGLKTWRVLRFKPCFAHTHPRHTPHALFDGWVRAQQHTCTISSSQVCFGAKKFEFRRGVSYLTYNFECVRQAKNSRSQRAPENKKRARRKLSK